MMNYRIILSRLLLLIGIVPLLLLSCGNETQLSQGEELTSVPVNVRLLTRMSSRAETKKVSDKDNLFNRLLLVVTKPDGTISDMQYYSNIASDVKEYKAEMELRLSPIDNHRVIHAFAFRIDEDEGKQNIFSINRSGVLVHISEVEDKLHIIGMGFDRELRKNDLKISELKEQWSKIVVDQSDPTKDHRILFSGQSQDTEISLDETSPQNIDIDVFRTISCIEAYVFKDKEGAAIEVKNLKIKHLRNSSLLGWNIPKTSWEDRNYYPQLMPNESVNEEFLLEKNFSSPHEVTNVLPVNWQNTELKQSDRLAYAFSAPISIETLKSDYNVSDGFPLMELTVNIGGVEKTISARIGEKTSEDPLKYEGDLRANKIYRVIVEIKENALYTINIKVDDWINQEINPVW